MRASGYLMVTALQYQFGQVIPNFDTLDMYRWRRRWCFDHYERGTLLESDHLKIDLPGTWESLPLRVADDLTYVQLDRKGKIGTVNEALESDATMEFTLPPELRDLYHRHIFIFERDDNGECQWKFNCTLDIAKLELKAIFTPDSTIAAEIDKAVNFDDFMSLFVSVYDHNSTPPIILHRAENVSLLLTSPILKGVMQKRRESIDNWACDVQELATRLPGTDHTDPCIEIATSMLDDWRNYDKAYDDVSSMLDRWNNREDVSRALSSTGAGADPFDVQAEWSSDLDDASDMADALDDNMSQ
jgi:hypothetical protein